MNRQETVALARYVKACCPAQAIDEYTPDAWYDLLGDLDLETCRQAAARVARRQPFVAPAEIRAGVHAERGRRLAACRSDELLPHGEIVNDVSEYLQRLRERIAATAAGQPHPAPIVTATGGKVIPASSKTNPGRSSKTS